MKKIFVTLLMLLVFANAPCVAFGWSGEPASSVNLANSAGATVAPKQNLAKGEASGGAVPVGIVVIWTTSSNPSDADKWLECKGQTITQAAYPELFAVVGSRVPDYRGLFLRGYGGNSSSLGVQQGDAIRNITGYWKGDVGGLPYRYEMGGAVGGSDYGYGDNGTGPWGEVMAFSFDASRTVPTANENRPINKAVRYLIRAKP